MLGKRMSVPDDRGGGGQGMLERGLHLSWLRVVIGEAGDGVDGTSKASPPLRLVWCRCIQV